MHVQTHIYTYSYVFRHRENVETFVYACVHISLNMRTLMHVLCLYVHMYVCQVSHFFNVKAIAKRF